LEFLVKRRPVAIGLVLCEHVIIEEGTRNVTPVNCFSFREVDDFPGHGSFSVVGWLADGAGTIAAELVVQRLDTLEEIYRDIGELNFRNSLNAARFMARVRDCDFPVPGYYEVWCSWTGSPLHIASFASKRKVTLHEITREESHRWRSVFEHGLC
jgi:hypothetical protein